MKRDTLTPAIFPERALLKFESRAMVNSLPPTWVVEYLNERDCRLIPNAVTTTSSSLCASSSNVI